MLSYPHPHPHSHPRAHPHAHVPWRLRVLAAVCLLLVAACGDRHEPTKPTTGPAAQQTASR